MAVVYKSLNNNKTPLLICGDPFTKCEDVIICISGNPGITDFYNDFAIELHKSTSKPVCVIGHAGHDEGTLCKGNSDNCRYGLVDQLRHKSELIENHIDKNAKIHFIGHSIGAWMIIELLKNNEQLIKKVSSVNLLCPTLQRMAESRNGIFLNNIVRKVYGLILFLCKLLQFLPTSVLGYLVSIYLLTQSFPFKFTKTIIKLLNPNVLENVLVMAFEEMDTVKALNADGLDKIKHLTNVIYASNDGWVPLEYMDDLKQFEPQLQMKESHKIQHAFIFKSSELVANMIADFINMKATR